MLPQNQDLFDLRLDETAKAHLLETTRWTRFLAICSIFFMIMFSLYALYSTYLTYSLAQVDVGNALLVAGGFMLLASTLYFYPIYALIKLSSCFKKGIQTGNQDLVNEGFRYQKAMFRYTGILTIISIVLMLLSIIRGGLSTLNIGG